MRESGYYPPGAEFDPSAPYNQCDPPDIDIEVTVFETLTKTANVVTNNAWYVTDEEGYTELEDTNFKAVDEYLDQNNLLSDTIKKAKEEITRLREEAERQQRKLEEFYGVRHNSIPGYYLPDISEDQRYWIINRRRQLSAAMERVRYLKALEENLDGWEHESIDIER